MSKVKRIINYLGIQTEIKYVYRMIVGYKIVLYKY